MSILQSRNITYNHRDILVLSELTTPCTSIIVVVESICLLAAIEHAGNFSVKVFSNPWI